MNKFNMSIVTSLDCPPEVKWLILEEKKTSQFLLKTQRKRKATNIHVRIEIRFKASWINFFTIIIDFLSSEVLLAEVKNFYLKESTMERTCGTWKLGASIITF